MKPAFVKTKNYLGFLDAMSGLAERGADECCLIAVDGNPGLGKTTILSRWAAENQCIYLRAKKKWQPYWMLGDLLDALRVSRPHGFERRFGTAVEQISTRAHSADAAGREFALVIDEADHVINKSDLVETIRDLADLTEVPTILVGMGKIRDGLRRYQQVSSRVSRYVGFEPADLQDVSKFLDEVCEVKVAPDLAKFVMQITGGYNREILEAIRSIEAWGFRNEIELTGVSMSNMAGLRLINDRKSGQPIYVPEARLMHPGRSHQSMALEALVLLDRSLDELSRTIGVTRRQAADAAAGLIAKGYAARPERGRYVATDAGRAFHESGVKITSGSKTTRAAPKQTRQNSIRRRAWNVMRIRVKFTLSDLIQASAHGSEGDPRRNLGKYCSALSKAGILRRLRGRRLERGLPRTALSATSSFAISESKPPR